MTISRSSCHMNACIPSESSGKGDRCSLPCTHHWSSFSAAGLQAPVIPGYPSVEEALLPIVTQRPRRRLALKDGCVPACNYLSSRRGQLRAPSPALSPAPCPQISQRGAPEVNPAPKPCTITLSCQQAHVFVAQHGPSACVWTGNGRALQLCMLCADQLECAAPQHNSSRKVVIPRCSSSTHF